MSLGTSPRAGAEIVVQAACKPPRSGNIETWLDKFEPTVRKCVCVKASRVVGVQLFSIS
jgi:hypothetical protein